MFATAIIFTLVSGILIGFFITGITLALILHREHEVKIYKKNNPQDPNGIRHMTVHHSHSNQ
jgi:hypothetical protein